MKVLRPMMAVMLACFAYVPAATADNISYTLDDESTTAVGCSSCGVSSCGGCDSTREINLIGPSDNCFDCFISPMTNPVFFEDPRTVSEARFIYLHHKVPIAAGGGEVDLWAVQLRAAVNDDLSIIATKDGYLTSSNPLIDDGWADVNLGVKYNLYKDSCNQQIISGGVTYELPVGSTRALQGNGEGMFNLFLSGGAAIGNGHWVTGLGWLIPSDSAAESEWMYWSNHFDTRIGNTNLYAVYEANWYHYLDSGAGGIAGVEGGDLFNFGSTGVTGNDIVTNAIGMKYKPSRNSEIGVAWEVPLTKRRDVLDNRLTFDFIVRY